MGAFASFGAKRIRMTVGQYVKVDPPGVVIEEPGVVERRRFPSQSEVILIAGYASQNQVGQDPLLLLPPSFTVMPSESVIIFTFSEFPFDDVVPAAALLVAACVWH